MEHKVKHRFFLLIEPIIDLDNQKANLGLIGVETPEDKGGWGGDFYQNIIGMEEQIYQMVPGLFNLQSDLVMPYILSDQIA